MDLLKGFLPVAIRDNPEYSVGMARMDELVAGQDWAWKESKSKPIKRARIVAAIDHARIRAEVLDTPGRPTVEAHSAQYWCRWEDLEDHLAERRWLGERLRAAQNGEPLPPWPTDTDGEPAEYPWRAVETKVSPAHARVTAIPAPAQRVAYTLEAAAAECGVSAQFLRDFVNRNDLIVHYANSKMIILAEDLRAWIAGLPTER